MRPINNWDYIIMIRYEPGDIAVFTPQNIPTEVDRFLEYMEWSDLADKLIHVQPSDGNKQKRAIDVH